MPRSNWYSDHPPTCNCRECTSRRIASKNPPEKPVDIDSDSEEYKRRQELLDSLSTSQQSVPSSQWPPDEDMRTCPTCDGTGVTIGRWATFTGGKRTRCPTCHGFKKVYKDHPLLQQSWTLGPIGDQREASYWENQLTTIDTSKIRQMPEKPITDDLEFVQIQSIQTEKPKPSKGINWAVLLVMGLIFLGVLTLIGIGWAEQNGIDIDQIGQRIDDGAKFLNELF